MSISQAARLDATQVAQFRREGYTICRDQVFGPEKFQALQRHFDVLLARMPADRRPESMDVPHFADVTLFDWLLADEVLDLVEPLIGPDIALFSSHFLCKPAGDGQRVPWHEDSAYWHGMFDHMEVCTVWLAIDRSDVGNSAMQVIPGTHLGKGGYSDYEPVPDPTRSVFSTEIKPAQYDTKRAVTLELEPGQAETLAAAGTTEPAWDEAADEPIDRDFQPFAEREPLAEPRRLLPRLLLVLAVLAAAAVAFWFLAPVEWRQRVGIAGAEETPLLLQVRNSDRQQLASGNELFAVSGRVINPTDRSQNVPPLRAELRDRTGKLIYSWTIAPPARTLGPGASASFNSAEVNVPQGADRLTVTLGAPAA